MKKILLIMLAFTVSMFAAGTQDYYNFVVDNPTMVDAYFNIFNAMAGMFNSESYNNLLKLVFLMGGFIVFATGVLKTYETSNGQLAISEFMKYMLVGTALLTFIHSNKKNLIITTNTFPTYCEAGTSHKSAGIIPGSSMVDNTVGISTGVVVGNIPEVLAWGFAFVNEIGTESTRIARTAFGSIDGTMVGETPSEFASYLTAVGKVMSVSLNDFTSNTGYSTDSTLGDAVSVVMNQCILTPATAGENSSKIRNTIFSTGDMIRTVDSLIKNSTLIVYKNPTILESSSTVIDTAVTINGNIPGNILATFDSKLQSCGTIWENVRSRLDDLKESGAIECNGTLRNVLNPSSMKVLTGSNAIPKSQAQEIALNAAVSNVVLNSSNNIMAGEMAFASGKSMAQFVNESMGTGYYMAQMLPYLQMGMRAVLYAFFPFVFVVVLLPGGLKILISYLQSLVWIELWSPTAAILDMFMELVAGTKFQEMYNNEGANMLNGIQTFSDTAMLASVAGYLYASVPALTWLILKGSGYMLGNISGAVAAKMSANMNTDSINRDITSMTSRDTVNNSRRSQLNDTLSMAEQDNVSAINAGRIGAGEWQAKNAHSSSLENAGKGNVLSQTATGIASERVLGDTKKFDNTVGVKELENEIVAKTGEYLELGDKNNIDKYGNSGAVTEAVKKDEGLKTQEKTGKVIGATNSQDYIKKASEVNSLSNLENFVAKDQQQEVMALVKKGMTPEQAVAEYAKSSAIAGVMDSEQKSQLNQKLGLENKDGSVNTYNLKTYAGVGATSQEIKVKTEREMQYSNGTKALIAGAVAEQSQGLGNAQGIQDKQEAALKGMIAEGSVEAKKVYDKTKNMSPAAQIRERSKFMAKIGALHKGATDKSSDNATANFQNKGGTLTAKQDYINSEFFNKLSTGINSMNELSDHASKTEDMIDKNGNVVMDTNGKPKQVLTEDAKGVAKLINNYHESTGNHNRIKEGDSVLEQRVKTAITSNGVLSYYNANKETYQAISGNAEIVEKMNQLITPTQEGTTQGFVSGAKTMADTTINEELYRNNITAAAIVTGMKELTPIVNMTGKALSNIVSKISGGKNKFSSDTMKGIDEAIKNNRMEDVTRIITEQLGKK